MTKITILYLEEETGYFIIAKDSKSTEALENNGIKMRYKEGIFCASIENLPEIDNIIFKKHLIKAPTAKSKKVLEEEYEEYLKMERELDELYKKIETQRKKVINKLGKIGLKIKPGLPKDSQLYMENRETRIHNCTSITRNYDIEAIEKAISKYPILERCFDFKKVTINFDELSTKDKNTLFRIANDQDVEFYGIFNKASFKSIEANLPSDVKKKLVTIEANQSFRETELLDSDCKHCGGHTRKDGSCKRCNLE